MEFLTKFADFFGFQGTEFCRRVLKALPSDLDDVFVEVTAKNGTKDIVHIIRTVYCKAEDRKRTTDQLIGDCVRKWTSHLNKDAGVASVSQVLDPIFIQESTWYTLRRLGSWLDAIVVLENEGRTVKLAERKSQKNQVLSWLFSF